MRTCHGILLVILVGVGWCSGPLPRLAGQSPQEASGPETPHSEQGEGKGGEDSHSREGEPAEVKKEKGEEHSPRLPLYAVFEDGVLLSTHDEEFQLRIQAMEQTDIKYFLPTFQQPARSGAYIPRFRIYFDGCATRSFEYELSLQRSVEGTFDVLDGNINFRPSEAVQLKVGRFLVPYSYEWFDHLEQFFIAPERSLFPLNFGLSREAGVMVWGKVLEERLQYAFGVFSGQISGLADNNTSRDMVGYVNFKPFLTEDAWPALRFFNIGGSLAVGRQAYPESPLPMRTSLQSSENDEAAQGASTVFLEFNNGVASYGNGRVSGALHLAWYVNQFSLETEAQAGRFPYRRLGQDRTVKLPVHGYNVTMGYFVTGETVEGRKVVVPLRPFNPVSGQHGPGAVELFARYSTLTLGEEVFTADLADPELWTRSAQMTDIGCNWYPNRYLKFVFDWQHTMFGTPVVLNESKGLSRRSVDLFWVRCQLWF